MANAVEIERQLKFFREKRKFSFIRAITELKSRLLYRKLKSNALQRKLNYIADLQKSALPSTLLSNMYRDMQFNIEPKADVYKKDNPDEEEAIACIEALARVPQQVNKWGHKTVAALWPGLYKIYYKEVIPEVERTLTSR